MKQVANWFKTHTERDPRYVLPFLVALIVLGVTTLNAHATHLTISTADVNFFNAINDLPGSLIWVFYIIIQLGTLPAVIVWAAIAAYKRNWLAGLFTGLTGLLAWLAAKLVKDFVRRGRPQFFIHHPHLLSHEIFSGYGFPSGHATVVAACVTAIYFYVEPKYRKYLLLIVLLVGFGRIYVGGHFPSDVIGGWALGTAVGTLVALTLGLSQRQISSRRLKRTLHSLGLSVKTVTVAKVDARSSLPLRAETERGQKLFVKLYRKQELTADWLYRTFRFFIYKNLGEEEPLFSRKRSIEHEALATIWARKQGARVPEVYGYYRKGSQMAIALTLIRGRALKDIAAGNISDALLRDILRQVATLQEAQLAHRDLRTANIIIDEQDQPWLIDFSFAEIGGKPVFLRIDVAEILMSLSLVVGVDRTLKAARQVLGRDELLRAAPYVQLPAFPASTRIHVRKNRPVYKELRQKLAELSGKGVIKEVPLVRVRLRTLINFGLLTVFLIIILPQLRAFHGSLGDLGGIRWDWIGPLVLASVFTYFAAAMTIISLSDEPLRLREVLPIQLAGSYTNRLLPGQLGTAAIMVRFLKRAGHDLTSAIFIVTAQRLLDTLMLLAPFVVLLLFQGNSLKSLIKFHISPFLPLIILLILLLAVIAYFFIKPWQKLVRRTIKQLRSEVNTLRDSPHKLELAAVFSFGLTASYLLCVYFALLAVGLHLSWLAVLLSYMVAEIVGSITPTPGGLGGYEIAMAVAFIGFGLPRADAYAAVILYRLATFWLPIPIGIFMYYYAQHKRLI